MKIESFKISLLIMGLSGTVGQIVVLRELLVSFLGNEFTIGIILANWLMLEAIGSFWIGRSVEKIVRKMEYYVLFQLIFAVSFPFAVYLSRIFKNFLLPTPGEGLGFAPTFYASFFVLLPMALSHGALFTYGSKLYSQYFRKDTSPVGKVYLLETLGSMIGGLLITFLLIQYLNSFEIAFGISLTNALISVLLLWPRERFPRLHLRRGLWISSILLSLLFGSLLSTPLSNKIHSASIRSQWRRLEVIHDANSIYGNIIVTKRGEQFTFFTDGIPSITIPVPDLASIEDFVHFSMLFHDRPRSVLILSGGVGGMIHEILKHPVTRVDYVELDPLLLRLVQTFSTPLTLSELSDQRVKVHYTDGRFFLKRTRNRFDLIFIGLSVPQQLQTNRLFSAEFFVMTKEKMNPRGIIALTLPGSLTYISPELKDLNGCILDTLRGAYRHVRIIPGDVNLYLASDSAHLEMTTIEEVTRRLEERGLKTSLFTKNYVAYRLHERWLDWFSKEMEGRSPKINSDFRPLGVYFSLSYWNALFSPYLSSIFIWFQGLRFRDTIPPMTLITLGLSALFVRIPLLSKQSLPYAIFMTGCTGMTFSLAIVFTFQTLYGYLYHQIGLLVTIFMGGIAFGSLLITQRLDRMKGDALFFFKTELLIIGFSFLLPLILSIPSGHLEKKAMYVLLYSAFLASSFLSGFFVGLEFPLATKIYLSASSKEERLGHAAGWLYGADLLGGFFGALFGGILLLPILGLKESCFLMGFMKMSSALVFLLFMRIRK